LPLGGVKSLVIGDFCQWRKAHLRTKILHASAGIPITKGLPEMTLFDPSEKVEFIASQNFHYDNYSGYGYYLERVDVQGKCGLVCVEELEDCGTHSKIILQPIYDDIRVHKISTTKANYDKYAVFASGSRIGDFTLVLNAWVPRTNF
jgi:hypothetical protein